MLNATVLHLHDGAAELALRPISTAFGTMNIVLVEDGRECWLVASFRQLWASVGDLDHMLSVPTQDCLRLVIVQMLAAFTLACPRCVLVMVL